MNRELQDNQRDCRIAYKEWAGVCDALGSGRQSILLRKGGIREDGGVFRPDHPRFWLYPTNVHESEQGLREVGPSSQSALDGMIAFELHAEVEFVWWIDRIETILSISETHVWTEESIRKRFVYRSPGLWILSVRVDRLESPVLMPERPEYSGCKSWVHLDRAIAMEGLQPILSDREALERRNSLESNLRINEAGR